MSPADTLMLDAKQAILDEAHNRFLTFQKEGRTKEALHQFQVTLSCATDLLNESILVLESVLSAQKAGGSSSATSTAFDPTLQ